MQQQDEASHVRGFAGTLTSASKPKTGLMRLWGQPAQSASRAGMAAEAAAELHNSYRDDITPDCPDELRRLQEVARRSEASSPVREPRRELVGAASGSPAMSHAGASTAEAVAYTGFRQGEDSRAAASAAVRSTDCSDREREAFAGGGFGSRSSPAWDVSGPGLKAEYSSSSLQASQVIIMHPSRFRARMPGPVQAQIKGLRMVSRGSIAFQDFIFSFMGCQSNQLLICPAGGPVLKHGCYLCRGRA